MKNKINWITIIVAAILLAVSAVFLTAAVCVNAGFLKELPQRMYRGDRLTLNVMAKADGQSVELTEASVTCFFDDEPEHELPICFKRLESFNQEFSIPGGEYGGYTFTVHSGDNIIKAEIHNTNWWNVASVNLIYDIDTESQTMSYIFYDQSGVVSAEQDGRTYAVAIMV